MPTRSTESSIPAQLTKNTEDFLVMYALATGVMSVALPPTPQNLELNAAYEQSVTTYVEGSLRLLSDPRITDVVIRGDKDKTHLANITTSDAPYNSTLGDGYLKKIDGQVHVVLNQRKNVGASVFIAEDFGDGVGLTEIALQTKTQEFQPETPALILDESQNWRAIESYHSERAKNVSITYERFLTIADFVRNPDLFRMYVIGLGHISRKAIFTLRAGRHPETQEEVIVLVAALQEANNLLEAVFKTSNS